MFEPVAEDLLSNISAVVIQPRPSRFGNGLIERTSTTCQQSVVSLDNSFPQPLNE
jgi:hypothetical protein